MSKRACEGVIVVKANTTKDGGGRKRQGTSCSNAHDECINESIKYTPQISSGRAASHAVVLKLMEIRE
ncbi:uncharacterized protein PHALS_05191 [Plasmopara halstedii]|uniref:Uncharacterized protein n=1 Tax=Plasmopara halstedii TaxID=4781 RepID=A0A0P1B115_PLAHL|nr:uncharacterized protein PHALS_05191 [Plasmopara halstedii]CEG47863.1 hypothetical protein PHALS_05191 [Plasmopara halstedii]|eukprot:XP_024584232.1 hypothetical protein PHALS_05191 [Plasmopara halstedii]